jgi:hypothetical protein
LPAWLSDALCRLASGGSFAVRQLYTNDEEVLFKAARPTLLNGIEDIIGRSDLADRAILLTLGPIGEEQRRSETELWREFELARPAILGALLDAAAHGLRAAGSVHLGRLPRMADFALWATACETGLWPANTFTRAYAANRKAAIEGIIDADPIAACVRELMSERPSWTGRAYWFPDAVFEPTARALVGPARRSARPREAGGKQGRPCGRGTPGAHHRACSIAMARPAHFVRVAAGARPTAVRPPQRLAMDTPRLCMTPKAPLTRGAFFRCSGVGVRTGLVAATDSTSLLTELASRHPPLDSTGVPVGDGLRPIDAQF